MRFLPFRKEALPELSLVAVELRDTQYRADLELHDRYQTFARELMRLALAELGGLGFLLANVGAVKSSLFANALRSEVVQGLGVVSVLALGVAVAASMAHGFYASDCLYHHLRALKLLVLDRTTNLERARAEEASRNANFDHAETALYLAAGALMLGTAALGLAVILALVPPSAAP
ncbi:MAG: hypothetical protein HY816_06970 [Candidatus Wallbacteria bacterium]|nr:hypothetical protein [Candidatus Wallbacteria bacterium]